MSALPKPVDDLPELAAPASEAAASPAKTTTPADPLAWLQTGLSFASGHVDERSHGPAREAWQRWFGLAAAPHALADKLGQASAQVAKDVAAHGITYNVYADSHGPRRPWALDTLPVLLTPADWVSIEAGVLQRAKLLNAVLADVYGPQTLLKNGLLPSALVHGHPGYLRPMHGVQAPNGAWLHLAAFDLARGPDGQWALISQRTQAPSGLGYLLENRLIIARQFPDAFRELQVQRLAESYRVLIDGLLAHCPRDDDKPNEPPRLALLTPGPYNETHFEHAYLAKYLGLALVEGSDLVVRHNKLYLRTLGGLQRVNGLLKRLDDEYLDPLELRQDSALGVAGLMQAVRSGQVLLANMPGTGFLESPALLGFLPAVAQHLLGEPLQLPAIDTWWCGEPAALADALPRLAQLVIKPTQAGGPPSVIGRTMNRRALDELTGRIVRQPHSYTVQRFVPLSQTPTFHGATAQSGPRLEPRSHMVRVFAVLKANQVHGQPQWHVLPGGLARIAGAAHADVVSMQYGGSSADAWVMGHAKASGPRISDGLPPPLDTQTQTQTHSSVFQASVTSRAAENLFWFGRYTERCEHSARLVRLALQCLNAVDPPSAPLCNWLRAVGMQCAALPSDAPMPQTDPAGFERCLIEHASPAPSNSGVGYNLGALRQTADAVRERLSADQWQLIQRAEAQFNASMEQGTASPAGCLAALEQLIDDLAAITGSQIDRMTRDNGWRMLSVGRQLERLHQLSQALALGLEHGCTSQADAFDALLQLFDSGITYRSRYSMRRDLPALLDVLVQDPDNPRALTWVAGQLRGRLSKLAGAAPTELSELAAALPNPVRLGQGAADLQSNLEHLARAMLGLSDELSARYFRHLRNSMAV